MAAVIAAPRALLLAAAIAWPAPRATAAPAVRRATVDVDAAAEAKSAFWDEAVHPGAAANRVRLDDAVRLLWLPTGDRVRAVELLDAFTRAAPGDADGWGYLAIAAERLARWSLCGDAYARARAVDPRWRPLRLIDARTSPRDPKLRPLPLATAMCQARGGALDAAARTLADAVARGEATPALWLRAGEIAMAQGRLDDAIAALERAGTESGARWQLAIAHDRARHDDRAQAVADVARDDDPLAGATSSARAFAIVPADADYLRAFAALRDGRPEEAIAHFRTYVALAPDAPWVDRARAHLDALAGVDLTPRVVIDGGSATAEDGRAIIAAVRAARPALEACVASVPTGLQQLKLWRRAPLELKPSPFDARGRRGRSTPPIPLRPARSARRAPAVPPVPVITTISASSTIRPVATRPRDPIDLEEVHRCLERVGATLHLPAVGPGGELVVLVPVIAR